jgi:hypothetical protein
MAIGTLPTEKAQTRGIGRRSLAALEPKAFLPLAFVAGHKQRAGA